ncbi:MAG: hypothetical protein OI74_13255 [Gammaproteobacteria bacterium (ex Lamellibrachia satsuma)]|nr:MAG: hypothetical protein OI74_13255 [Gammaproteobacteria bacterium (ex Lamellibrachia satsuma)]RRS35352.1 MAG: hypothetical protein NV67_10755 [Gammaproteobacteria bacterium (ex Lamellibrachia satsuma)]
MRCSRCSRHLPTASPVSSPPSSPWAASRAREISSLLGLFTHPPAVPDPPVVGATLQPDDAGYA